VTSSGASPSNTSDDSLDPLTPSELEERDLTRSFADSSSVHRGTSCTLSSPISTTNLHSTLDCLSSKIILRCIHVSYVNVSLNNDMYSKYQNQRFLSIKVHEHNSESHWSMVYISWKCHRPIELSRYFAKLENLLPKPWCGDRTSLSWNFCQHCHPRLLRCVLT
jgi:hypothetical protein